MGTPTPRLNLRGQEQLVTDPRHFLAEALALSRPVSNVNQLTLDIISLLSLEAEPALTT